MQRVIPVIRLDNCPLCGGSRLDLLKRYEFTPPQAVTPEDVPTLESYYAERLTVFFDHIWNQGGSALVDAVLCGSCGLIFTNPRMTEADIETKYRVLSEMETARARARKRPPLNTAVRADRIQSLVLSLIDEGLLARGILDYGGAEGLNLAPFVDRSPCFVIDYMRHRLPDGVAYLGKDLQAIENGRGFGLILLLHTLEHMVKPVDMVRELSECLAPGGLLYVEVPLGAFREWKTLREPITHVNFFSEQSALECFSRSGLEVVHLSTDYQWVTHGGNWCVNIVGRKPPPEETSPVQAVRHRSTRRQMRNPRYYLPLVGKRLRGLLGKRTLF